MNKNNIKKINKKTLLNINNLVTRIASDGEEIKMMVELKFQGLFEINATVKSLIDAIFMIASNTNNSQRDSGIIMDLCSLAQQLIPIEESQFIDDLIIQKSYNKEEFVPLDSL